MRTSKELSKKLADNGCELETISYNIYLTNKKEWLSSVNHKDSYIKYHRHINTYDILNDICVKYAKEMFGEEEGDFTLYDSEETFFTKKYLVHTSVIFPLIQQNKHQEAEDYIWEHCKFNPKNL